MPDPILLRHGYRMLGDFAGAEELLRRRGVALGSLTLRCLERLEHHHHRHLPQNESGPAKTLGGEADASDWITPAPDAKLFANLAEAAAKRESVSLSFIALLQHLPPRQRAMLLLRDVSGWSTGETARLLRLTLSGAASALRRARAALAGADVGAAHEEPSALVLRAYAQAWRARDARRVCALLREDVIFALPPHASWFRGAREVRRFLRTGDLWPARLEPARANGCPAWLFYRRGSKAPFAVHISRFLGGKVAEAVTFLDPHSLQGFAPR